MSDLSIIWKRKPPITTLRLLEMVTRFTNALQERNNSEVRRLPVLLTRTDLIVFLLSYTSFPLDGGPSLLHLPIRTNLCMKVYNNNKINRVAKRSFLFLNKYCYGYHQISIIRVGHVARMRCIHYFGRKT